MTTNKGATEMSQQPQPGDGGAAAPPSLSSAGGGGKNDNQASRGANPILKSGPLFISSKGIGWTSWKKRWFILTKTSLVFFRSDPSVVAQKGSEANLTLGGIDLNNSGSVVVKADKKLLTVLFPDGRDGRAFTLKAETSEDLYEWKTALENALSQAPCSANMMAQNGVIRNDQPEAPDPKVEKSAVNEKPPAAMSLVLGRPILLALEDVDGSPSFLEKALKFMEDYGVKVEGILRQAADVDDVEHRIREYEQGKTDFAPGEDAHVIGDCIKYFLRELPSSPVPASCCHALLDACKSERGNRVASMRTAIIETFPEPNRRLLQRILLMMQQVAAHKEKNRMSNSAVAACMAPLLLRPLLSGDCEIDSDFDVGGDGSVQLLQAAAAANHAQAIVITLLEEYDAIFSDGAMSPGLYSDSEEGVSEDEEVTEDDESYEDEDEDEDEIDEGSLGSEEYSDEDIENGSNGSCSGSHVSGEDDPMDTKGSGNLSSHLRSSKVDDNLNKVLSSSDQNALPQGGTTREEQGRNESKRDLSHSGELARMDLNDSTPRMRKSSSIAGRRERRMGWGRTSAKKNLSMESIDFTLEDEEAEIQKLEASKVTLLNKIAEEAEGNAALQANLQERKKVLRERRRALKQDVTRLREQLQMEREKRRVLESGLNPADELSNIPDTIDEQTKADLEEISQANVDITDLQKEVDNLSVQLIRQHEQSCGVPPARVFIDQSAQNAHQGKLQKDGDATNPLSAAAGKSSRKDGRMNRTRSAKDKKLESNSNKTMDPAGQSGNSNRSTSFKKSGTKTEDQKPSTALTKLTNRLNFLKERRGQAAAAAADLHHAADKGTTAATDKNNRGSESIQGAVPDHPDGSHKQEAGGQSSERSRKQQPDQLQLVVRNPSASSSYLEGLQQHHQGLDKGRTESHDTTTENASKTGQAAAPEVPRTLSR